MNLRLLPKSYIDDLIKVIKNNRRSHFFGSLVSVYVPSGRNTEFFVIDGQQHLTTVSLLFLAMYNLISNGMIVSEGTSLEKQIYEDFLMIRILLRMMLYLVEGISFVLAIKIWSSRLQAGWKYSRKFFRFFMQKIKTL